MGWESGEIENIEKNYNSCSYMEQQQFIKILTELSEKGYSQTLEQLYLYISYIKIGRHQNGLGVYNHLYQQLCLHNNPYLLLLFASSTICFVLRIMAQIFFIVYLLYKYDSSH